MSRSDIERLDDILGAVSAVRRAERLLEGDGGHAVEEVAVAAIQYWIFTIGEAVKALPTGVTARRPDVPWSKVARMRDLIGHHYYKLDAQIVRATIGEPLVALEQACLALRQELEREA